VWFVPVCECCLDSPGQKPGDARALQAVKLAIVFYACSSTGQADTHNKTLCIPSQLIDIARRPAADRGVRCTF